LSFGNNRKKKERDAPLVTQKNIVDHIISFEIGLGSKFREQQQDKTALVLLSQV
jgi:hypothetical protein